MRLHSALRIAISSALLLTASVASAVTYPCSPCVGVLADDLDQVLAELERSPELGEDAHFWLAWTVDLDGSADPALIKKAHTAGATPWLRVVFRTPHPLMDNLTQLEEELANLAAFVSDAPDGLSVQAIWQPRTGTPDAEDHAFLIKRAAVTVTGATEGASFIAGPFSNDIDYLRTLYAEEVAAYLDGLAVLPDTDIEAFYYAMIEFDPGKPITVDSFAWPESSASTLALAAEASSAGAALSFFDTTATATLDLAPLAIMAREFAGELSYSEYGAPLGALQSWAFVRAEDLGLRVIAETDAQLAQLQLIFGDDSLRNPKRLDLATGEATTINRQSRAGRRFTLTVDDPGSLLFLELDRATAAELQGFDEEIEIAGRRQIPVEEILRRLQAFEDDQARRLDHYQATNALHLRFRGTTGTVEASYRGDFFYKRDAGFDWVWEDFFLGGVKWRSQKLPELPLIQPEKVSSLPTEIRFTKDYVYRLRGEATVDDRDCWVIDFEPIAVQPGQTLYQGTVWVDKEVSARVRTRALQIGLAGDVISNEETTHFRPLDALGQPSEWSKESFILPTRVVGQQTFSVLSATLPIERETVLTDIVINGDSFTNNREAALASDHTMVRDTDQGLRYLRKDEDGQRIVESEIDTSRIFLVGGVFWDESVDFPIPLAGANYLDLNFKDTGHQLNFLFAGAYLNGAYSNPDLYGSKWNLGTNVSAFFIKRKDQLYREGAIVDDEEVKSRNAAAAVYLGRPIGPFLKFDLTYRIRHNSYSRGDQTASDFVLPSNHVTSTYETELTYSRSGYRLGLTGSYNSRSKWDSWGLPGNIEYDPDHKNYTRYRAILAKTWWLGKFRKLGVTLEHLGGDNLDRFSGFDFGIFGDSSVAGYQSGLVRGDQANGVHVTFGLNVHDLVRIEAMADAVWASNSLTGLDNELLSGIGIGGTLTLPWQMATNFEIGYAVGGPGEGNFAARIVFLKLFPEH
ncbi:MAG: hypothetical protein GY906_05365 [bacterium]|nr:hypothetical protein [bacterium]